METRVLTLFDDEEFFPKEQPKENPKKEKTPKDVTVPLEENHLSEKKDTAGESSVTVHPEEKLPENETISPAGTSLDQTETPTDTESDFTEADQSTSGITEETTMELPAIEKETISYGIHKELPPVNIETKPEIIISDKATDNAAPEDVAALSDEETVTDDNIPESAFVNEIEEDETIPPSDIEDDEITVEQEEVNIPLDEATVSEEGMEEEQEIVTTPTESDKELSKQILSELIQLDYTALIQKDYAFDVSKSTVVTKKQPVRREPIPEEPNEEEEDEEEEVFEDVTPLPEWNLDKKYYTIGEVAQLFEVNTSHIRFWTNEFKLKPRTTRKGDRLYSPKDIAELRLIHHLVKVKKHTIKGAREKLKSEKSGVNNKLDLKESLEQLKDTLLKIREQL